MGGLLFQTKRLSAEQYRAYEEKVCSKLRNHHINFNIPHYFLDKKDFGDLDILIPKGYSLEDIKTWLKPSIFDYSSGIQDTFMNGSVISVKYNNFQIDFIRISSENWDIAENYFSWNDLGNLIGRIYHKFNLKYGMDGLYYTYKVEEQNVGKISISKDIEKILTFIGLDYFKFKDGFKDRQDIFNFVIKSPYFNPFIYDFENTNNVNRIRDKKRTTYKEWLNFIEPMKETSCSYEQWREEYPREILFSKVIDFFPEANLVQNCLEIDKSISKQRERTEKFNGNIVMEITKLQGKELGRYIQEFKSYFRSFTEFLDRSTKEEVRDCFLEFVKKKEE